MESLATASCTLQELADQAKHKQAQHEEFGLVDVDDEVNWRNDLPKRFSLLEERHFPLFITFDQVHFFLHKHSWIAIVRVSANSSASSLKPTLLIPKSPQGIPQVLHPSAMLSIQLSRWDWIYYCPMSTMSNEDNLGHLCHIWYILWWILASLFATAYQRVRQVDIMLFQLPPHQYHFTQCSRPSFGVQRVHRRVLVNTFVSEQ